MHQDMASTNIVIFVGRWRLISNTNIVGVSFSERVLRVSGRKAFDFGYWPLENDDLREPSWAGPLLTADALLGTAVQPCVPDPSQISHDIRTPSSRQRGIWHARAAPLCVRVCKSRNRICRVLQNMPTLGGTE